MTGESVEQAARVAGWRARAEREAAAILANTDAWHTGVTRNSMLAMLSIAWIQGVEYGMHDVLGEVDTAFENMRAAL